MDRAHTLATVALAVLLVGAGCLGPEAGGETPTPDGPADGSLFPTGVIKTTETLDVHSISAGQADSTLIVGPDGETMLIDTGHYEDDGEYVLQYLREHDIDRIDHLVISHADADHIGGTAAVIEYFETEADGVGAIYDPGIASGTETYEEYLDAVEQYNVTLSETREGDVIPFGGATVDVLGPPERVLANGTRNANSIVLKITHGETSFLFTGDAESVQERYLVEYYESRLDSTVLKIGHHGSGSSSNEAFLDAVNPAAVIVSSAYDSPHGHPYETVLGRLTARSIPAYWTGTHGSIRLTSDGSRVTVRTQRADPTTATALRSGKPIPPGANGSLQFRGVVTGGSLKSPLRVTESGWNVHDGWLTIARLQADAPGDDRINRNGEYVTFRNTGPLALDLGGWTVRDSVGHRYTVPEGFSLDPGSEVTLHTGSGVDNQTHLYWGEQEPVWNNDGDIVLVTSAEGYPVLRESYS